MLRKRIAALVCAAALTAACTVTLSDSRLVLAAYAAGVITKTQDCQSSDNSIYTANHIYGNQEKTKRSYLYQSGENQVTRVEFITTSTETVDLYDLDTGYVLVEDIDMTTGKLIKSRKLDLSQSVFLPLFGAFYVGENYIFVVTGQKNLSESDDQNVIAVTRITKDFKSYKTKMLKGRNTYVPFKAGSCKMAEAGGKLYIHTCHQMYQSSDGLRHQMNMSYVFDIESMTFDQEYYKVEWHFDDAPFPFVSHSFDQYLLTDGSAVYSYDHGDANPRALTLSKYDLSTKTRTDSEIVDIPSAKSNTSYNYTGVLTGGMALSKNNVLISAKMADMTASELDNYYDLKDICVAVYPKSSIGTSAKAKIVNLTNYTNKAQSEGSTGRRNSAPQLVKINDNRFLVMWKECTGNTRWYYTGDNKDGVTKLAVIDGSGSLIGKVTELDADIQLSECDPVLCSDGMVRWYSASGSAPTLYALDPDDPTDFSGGKVTRVPGDLDGDGKVTLKDGLLIKQHLAEWNVKINESNADVDGDGKVTLKDAILLCQYLANWKVTLK